MVDSHTRRLLRAASWICAMAYVLWSFAALAGIFIVRRRDRELGECPLCASRIPYESTHCTYCGSGVTPGEP
jgi:hypothetical protein